jgi:VanZ family protein
LHLRRALSHRPGVGVIIAGSLPNFLAVLILSLAASLLKPDQTARDQGRRTIFVAAGLILYEVAQIWMPHRVFDWNDIAATVLGALFVWLLMRIPPLLLRRQTEDRST